MQTNNGIGTSNNDLVAKKSQRNMNTTSINCMNDDDERKKRVSLVFFGFFIDFILFPKSFHYIELNILSNGSGDGRWTKGIDFLFSTSNRKIAFHLWCYWSLKFPSIQSKKMNGLIRAKWRRRTIDIHKRQTDNENERFLFQTSFKRI